MKLINAVCPLLFSVVLSGCNSVSMNYDYDANFDFSTLKYYSWLEVPNDFPANEITINRIKNAVDQQLTMKGLEKSAESPDFRVSMLGFKDIIREGVVTGTTYSDYPGHRTNRRYPGYRGYGRYEEFERRYEVNEFEQGTLTLTMIDAARNALIWEGTVTMILEPERSTEYKQQKTQETIAKLLANFPPIQKP
jgi:hypothetical protein